MSNFPSRNRHIARPTPVIDEVAISRACAGERVQLYSNELQEAVRRLSDQGLICVEIAERLGACLETVRRHRKRMGYPSTVLQRRWHKRPQPF
jgi:DNA-binding NarL/FixJ family response regulator